MEAPTATKLDDQELNKLAELVAAKVIQQLNRRKHHSYEETGVMTFEEARKMLFHGKSRDWIKLWIFKQHPDVLTTEGGWITPPKGGGVPIQVIDVPAAKEWLKKNQHTIDWSAPEPITMRRRSGIE